MIIVSTPCNLHHAVACMSMQWSGWTSLLWPWIDLGYKIPVQIKRLLQVPTEKTNTNLLAFPYHQDYNYCKFCNSPFVFVRWESFGNIVDRIEYLHGRTNTVESRDVRCTIGVNRKARCWSVLLPTSSSFLAKLKEMRKSFVGCYFDV